MRKQDAILLGYVASIYLVITTLAVASEMALISLAIAIFIVAAGLSVFCTTRNCTFTK